MNSQQFRLFQLCHATQQETRLVHVSVKTNLLGEGVLFPTCLFARGLYSVMRRRIEHSGRQAAFRFR